MLKSEQKDKWSVATKMLRDIKLATKDCFGVASQDDSSNAVGQQKILIQIEDSH